MFTLEEIRENLGISQETFEEVFAELSPEFVKDNTTKDGTVTRMLYDAIRTIYRRNYGGDSMDKYIDSPVSPKSNGDKADKQENKTRRIRVDTGGDTEDVQVEQPIKESVLLEEPEVNTKEDTTNDTEESTFNEDYAGVGREIFEQAKEKSTKVREERKRRERKKTQVETEDIPTDIDSVPPVVLRKFLANNFSVNPEKIFYLDDNGVREKINSKYTVLEREGDYLFIKKGTSILSVKKENN
jgi:hypothetical protein